jgi:hypothetical protein
MKILLLIGLTIALCSCTEKKADRPDQSDSLKLVDNSTKTNFEDKQDDCHVWLADSDTTLLTGDYIETGQKTNINYKFKCKAAFARSCIDSLILSKDMLTIEWIDWTNDGQQKIIRTEEFKLVL